MALNNKWYKSICLRYFQCIWIWPSPPVEDLNENAECRLMFGTCFVCVIWSALMDFSVLRKHKLGEGKKEKKMKNDMNQ